ncbi:MAG: hypothetical protein LBL69_05940 [Zoogloeaceae bacterium]|jgi:hypothetical protein|nr:hypothetical protein [Zoogloeaceae bacterium]
MKTRLCLMAAGMLVLAACSPADGNGPAEAAPAAAPAPVVPEKPAAFQDFRTHNVNGCIQAYLAGGVPEAKVVGFCNCVMDGVVGGLTPQEIAAVDEARRTGKKAPEIDAKIETLLPKASTQCASRLQ